MIPFLGIVLLLVTRPVVPAARLSADAAVVSRCARHFGCSREMFRSSLAKAAVSEYPPGDYTVWLTHKNGLVYPTLQRRTKPTAVLLLPLATHAAARAGVEAATGNPIEPFRPAEYVVVVTEPVTRPVEKPVYTEVLVKVGDEG